MGECVCKKMTRRHFDVTEGPLMKKAILYTIPIILTGILQLLFNAADLMVVGTKAEFYVGAVGATSSVTGLLVNFFMGLGGGVSVAVSQALGAKDYDRVRRTVHSAIPLAVICGILITVGGMFYTEPMLGFMDTPAEIIDYSEKYMKIIFLGMVPNLVFNFGAAVLRASGDTRTPLYALTGAGIFNVLLNLLMVLGFGLDVDGVAIATVVSHTVSAFIVLYSLVKRNDSCHLNLKEMCLDKRQVLAIMRIGIPAGMQSALYAIANILIQSSVNSFGESSVSGASAAMNIENFVYIIINAFFHTALNFTGQNYGAKRLDRVNKVYGTTAALCAIAGIFSGVLVYVFAEPLLSLYGISRPEAIEFAKVRMLYLGVPYFLCGIADVTTGSLRGLGQSILPMITCVLCICVFRVAWIKTVFAYYHDPIILYIAYPISWILVLIVNFPILQIEKRRLAKKLAQDQLSEA